MLVRSCFSYPFCQRSTNPVKDMVRPTVSIIVGILACALGYYLPASVILPSQFPSGRLTSRTTHSCTYSNGLSPGLTV